MSSPPGACRFITEDDILDGVSCLVFAPAGGAVYRLRLHRDQHPGDLVPTDLMGEFNIERVAAELADRLSLESGDEADDALSMHPADPDPRHPVVRVLRYL